MAEGINVTIDAQPMLRIAAMCKDDPAAIAQGEILGLETDAKQLEITNCFTTRTGKEMLLTAGTNQRVSEMKELEERLKREAARQRTRVRELLNYVDADCQCLGWWQTYPVTGLQNDQNAIEELHKRVTTTEPKSMILCFDLERDTQGQFPFRAFRLSEEYLAFKASGATGLFQESVSAFTEIPVKVKESVYNDCILMLSECDAKSLVKQEVKALEYIADSRLHSLAHMGLALEECVPENEKLVRLAKDGGKIHANLKRSIEKKPAGRSSVSAM